MEIKELLELEEKLIQGLYFTNNEKLLVEYLDFSLENKVKKLKEFNTIQGDN
jgi:hypothetical protein